MFQICLVQSRAIIKVVSTFHRTYTNKIYHTLLILTSITRTYSETLAYRALEISEILNTATLKVSKIRGSLMGEALNKTINTCFLDLIMPCKTKTNKWSQCPLLIMTTKVTWMKWLMHNINKIKTLPFKSKCLLKKKLTLLKWATSLSQMVDSIQKLTFSPSEIERTQGCYPRMICNSRFNHWI